VTPRIISFKVFTQTEIIFYSEPQTTKTSVALQYSSAGKHFKMMNILGIVFLGIVVLGIVILGMVVLGTVHSRFGPF
jgi:hypothetical protein